MSGREFQNLQEGLLYLFGPLALWWIALLVVGGALSVINFLIVNLYQMMRGRR